MMVYFKRFFGDMTGESVHSLILLQVRQHGLLHLELPLYIYIYIYIYVYIYISFYSSLHIMINMHNDIYIYI